MTNRKTTKSRSRTQKIVKQVIAKIRNAIQRGELQAGDRLPSVRELCNQYRVSQKVIDKVLDDLKTDEIIKTRPRSGCFITPQAVENLRVSLSAEDQQTSVNSDLYLNNFLLPRKGSAATMTVYITDMFPENIAVWKRLVNDFCRQQAMPPADVLTCHDGHPEDLFSQRPIDLLHTNPLLLENMGTDNFINLSDVGIVGEFGDLYLDVVKDHLSQGCHGPGIPFSLTLHYLFINKALFGQTKLTKPAITSLESLMKECRRIDEECVLENARTLALSSLENLPFLCGGIVFNESRQLTVKQDILRHFFNLLYKANYDQTNCLVVTSKFMEGNLLFLNHCSFTVPQFKSAKLGFPWEIIPLPTEVPIPSEMSVLAVSKRTRFLQQSIDLVRHIMQTDSQKQFGKLGGNLPVIKGTCQAKMHPHLNAGGTTETVLKQHSLDDTFWQWKLFNHTFRYFNDLIALNHGTMTPEDAITRLNNNLNVFYSVQ